MAERIVFKGMTPTEAAALGREQFLKLITSRERRSIKRNSLGYKKLLEKIAEKKGKGKPIRTHVREAVILPEWIGVKFQVHNGKEFQEITITAAMLGHRLGEFAYTTKRVQHSAPGIRATRGSKFLAVK